VTAGAGARALRATGVGVHFEGLTALEGVDLELRQGEILGLIGPNGAGKTTLVNVLSGFQRPNAGAVTIDDRPTAGWDAKDFARAGLGRTFQAARLFPRMTVLENVELPAVARGRPRTAARRAAADLLGLMGLDHRAGVTASALSYGEERLVGIARALALDPAFLLLDEPAAGLSPQEAVDLVARIGAIRARTGCGVLVIEHNIELILSLCERIQVLARGATLAVGSPGEIQQSAAVRDAYLGAAETRPARARRDAGTGHAPAADDLLTVDNLAVSYGPVRALSGVSLHVRRGEFVAVVGPNGAGKSTLLAAITGLVRPQAGRILLDGSALDGTGTTARVGRGIALVPEGRRILTSLTVAENLRVGETLRRQDPDAPERFEAALHRFPVLRAKLDTAAGLLSGGEQQQLAIARALLSGPRLLLLDEPSLGLAPKVVAQVYEVLGELNAQGMTILLMEQNATRALAAGDRAYVLRHGLIELEGPADHLRDDPRFDRAYFGFAHGPGIAGEPA
jgi:ABC-type branched-subunit amino acid transport system ATPase component